MDGEAPSVFEQSLSTDLCWIDGQKYLSDREDFLSLESGNKMFSLCYRESETLSVVS